MWIIRKTNALYLVVIGMLVAGLAITYFGYFRPLYESLKDKDNQATQVREHISWAINQLDSEYSKLRHIADKEYIERPKYSELYFVYEMTIAQAALLQEGSIRREINEAQIPADTIDESYQRLIALEPLIEKADSGDHAVLREISAELTVCLSLIFEFARVSGHEYQQHLRNKWLETREQLATAKTALIVATSVLAVLVLFLLVSLKLTMRARQEAEEHRIKAENSANAKARFHAAMSHEIRTPLNAVIGFADLSDVEEELMDPEELRENMQFIRNAGEQLSTLINGILDWSKIDSNNLTIHKELVSIKNLISDFHALYQQIAIHKGLSFEIEFAPEFPEQQYVDTTRINQILTNLVGNSIKFTKAGKRVSIEATADAKSLRFAVIDEGIGIAKDKLPLIFQEFVQADSSTTREYGGTGLGLAISKQLAKLMGGDIEVHSIEDMGSTFTLVLPREGPLPPTNKESDKDSGEELSESHPEQPKVLVVEDGAVNRKLIETILAKLEVEVMMACNGREGVEAAERELPDVIIMDLQMPEMDGFTATEIIRKQEKLAKIPILILSANSLDEEMQRARELGIEAFLTKPIKPDTLRAELAMHIHLEGYEKPEEETVRL